MLELNSYKNLKNTMVALDKIYKYLPDKRMKSKTIPSIFNKSYDENFISDFIAYVLDPNENGIGIGPLEELVRDYNPKAFHILRNLSLLEVNGVEVIREYTFSNGRRVDILIKVEEKLIIAIENKIYSKELKKQTCDYANGIKKKYENYECVLLYLTPSNDKLNL